MQLAGLIGNPVAHSLSPAMHNAAFQECGINARYELWHTEASEMPSRLDWIRETGSWANVTVPHKELAFSLVNSHNPTAQSVRAVNTIIPDGNQLLGDNTDVYGFRESLTIHQLSEPRSALVLGAGGASRAVLVALRNMGVQRIRLANRTRSRAEDLVQLLNLPEIEIVDPAALQGITPDTDLIINATSVGWHDDELPLPRAAFDKLPSHAIAYDLTYRDTAFLRAAAARSLTALDGLDMLVLQGARSFELWTGIEAPVHIMRNAAAATRNQPN